MGLFSGNSDIVYLKNAEIKNVWRTIIPTAAGQTEKFYAEVERRIHGAGLPDIPDRAKIQRKQVDVERKSKRNKEIGPYVFLHAYLTGSQTVLIGAYDYGTNLLISRYIVAAQDFSDIYSVFENHMNDAHLILLDHAVHGAAKQMIEDLKQDASTLTTLSKGLLDIS